MEGKTWKKRCERILNELNPTKSQRKFVKSVYNFICKNDFLYPTDAQEEILDRIWRHLERKALSDVERELLEDVGRRL